MQTRRLCRCALWIAKLCTAMQAKSVCVPGGVHCVQQAGQHQPRGGGWTPPQQLPAGALQTPHCPLLPVSSPSAACPVWSSTRGLRYRLQVAAYNHNTLHIVMPEVQSTVCRSLTYSDHGLQAAMPQIHDSVYRSLHATNMLCTQQYQRFNTTYADHCIRQSHHRAAHPTHRLFTIPAGAGRGG